LTVIAAEPEPAGSSLQSLDGANWRIAVDPKNEGREGKWFAAPRGESKSARVPGTIQQSYAGYHGAAWYWTEFASPVAETPERQSRQRWLIWFGSVDYYAEVWLNGTRLGDHEGSDGPFEFDVTDKLNNSGMNLLAVRVINPGQQAVDGFVIGEIPHSFKSAEHYMFGGNANSGGILQSVELRRQPAVRITDVFVKADPASGDVQLQATLDNSTGSATSCEIVADVDRLDGGRSTPASSSEQQVTAQPGTTQFELLLRVKQPKLWSTQEPNLYAAGVAVKATASGAGPISHRASARFGFRDFRVGSDGYFRLNGRRLFLKSCHTVNNFPVAIGMPHKPELMSRELLYAKAMGFDMVRFLGGPPLPEQLRICDEIGLMIYSEPRASWCLQDSPKMAERFDRSVSQLILRDRNHPCITIWGLLNETGDGPVSRHAAESLPLVRKLDPTRLVLVNSGRWDLSQSGEGVFAQLDWWRHSGGEPWAARNPADSPVATPFGFTWPPKQAALHPGPHGEYSVARWTAPAADRCTVTATFTGMAQATTDVYVLHNGRPLFNAALNIDGKPNTATGSSDATVAKGDTIDFVVGWGNSSHGSDSTATTAKIKTASREYDFAADFPRDKNPTDPWSCGTFAPGKQPDAATFAVYARSRSADRRRQHIGSLSNPGRTDWECLWGDEQSNWSEAKRADGGTPMAGDVHFYPRVPMNAGDYRYLRNLGGNGSKPVFLSESGVGSLVNSFRIAHLHEQDRSPADAEDSQAHHEISERLAADFQRYSLGSIFAFPEDLIRASELMHTRHRRLAYDAIRSNPGLCGYSLTGIIDQPAGEGLLTEWREPKLGIVDTMTDCLAPLRWCLFVEPMHAYAGRPFRIEAVMANDGVLGAGEYPVRMRIRGPGGIAWEKATTLRIAPASAPDRIPLATSVLTEEVVLDGPSGTYTLAAELERGGAARGGRLDFYLSRDDELLRSSQSVAVLGISDAARKWLETHGVKCTEFDRSESRGQRVILVGDGPKPPQQEGVWSDLVERIKSGATALFLNPAAFSDGMDSTRWLPLENRGKCVSLNNWVYHREDILRPHSVLNGLQADGLMDWYYYLDITPTCVFKDLPVPDEAVAVSAALALGSGDADGQRYFTGLLTGVYRLGSGHLVLNTMRILENLDANPAADRMLLNIVKYSDELTKASSPAPKTEANAKQ
jgi:hypothetical protein